MNLILTWDNPVPHPECGYIAEYRRMAASSYTTAVTSGSTSGQTSISIPVSAPANYEGAIYTSCCSGVTSVPDPFAVNAYSMLHRLASVVSTPSYHFTINIVADYVNPYDTYVEGLFNTNTDTDIPFTTTLPANTLSVTTTVDTVIVPTSGTTISNTRITAIAPVFNNGGTLQQLDPISTPAYFQLYWPTVPETSGSPIAQPSFILDGFEVTETDTEGNVTAGNLLVSWGQESVWGGGATPYDNFTFEVYEPSGSTAIGTVTVNAITKGLRNATIPLTKDTLPLTTSYEFIMQVKWDNEAVIGSTRAFYLPSY